MALVYKDRVKQTVDAPSTTDPFDFDSNGATPTGYVSFVDALADADTCIYAAEDTSGNWETGLGTWAEANKTLTRTTILASSNSGSAETFTGTVTVFIAADASRLHTANRQRQAHIQFASSQPYVRTDENTITIAAGEAVVNGKLLSWASSAEDFTSGTFPLDAAQMVYLYACEISGSVDFVYSTTGPTWSQDLQCWYGTGTFYDNGGTGKTPGTAGQARCIGAFQVWNTGATKRIIPFVAQFDGAALSQCTAREYNNSAAPINDAIILSSSGIANNVDATQISFASIATGSPVCVPSHAVAAYVQIRMSFTNADDEAAVGVGPISWAGNSGNSRTYAVLSSRCAAKKANEFPYTPAGRMPILTSNTLFYGADEIGTWVGTLQIVLAVAGWEIVL